MDDRSDQEPSVGEPMLDWAPPHRPDRRPLTGRYGRLEPLAIRPHAASLFAHFRKHPEHSGWTYLPYGPFDREEAFEAWIEARGLADDPMFFAIIDAATDQAVGVASFLNIHPHAGSIEVGHIHYSPALKRTRLATEAMYLMMKHVFELGYRRYEWKCDALNRPSRAAALRFGFSFEGIFRQHLVVKGRNRDTAWHACIDREWPALKAAYEAWLQPENFDDLERQHQRLADLTRPILKKTS